MAQRADAFAQLGLGGRRRAAERRGRERGGEAHVALRVRRPRPIAKAAAARSRAVMRATRGPYTLGVAGCEAEGDVVPGRAPRRTDRGAGGRCRRLWYASAPRASRAECAAVGGRRLAPAPTRLRLEQGAKQIERVQPALLSLASPLLRWRPRCSRRRILRRQEHRAPPGRPPPPPRVLASARRRRLQ